MTSVFSAINEELRRRRETNTVTSEPSPDFINRLGIVKQQLERAKARLSRAAQRSAQERYALGMSLGMAALLAVCAMLGGVFALADVPAWTGVAFLSGGIGAVLSVLQRMTTGRLQLDYHAGPQMLRILGGVRPFVGAVFGIALFAFLEGDWLSSFTTPSSPLAFYAALGFLAGFNERWAQDMIAGSGRTLAIPDGSKTSDSRLL
jgi:hypothetical protein